MPQINLIGDSESLPDLVVLADVLVQLLKDVQGGGGSSRPLPTDVKGHIYLKLYFDGKMVGTAKQHRVEKSFRLMKDDPRTISEARLKLLADRIKSKFRNFTFTTGLRSYTYNVPEQGFNRIWGYFNSEADARKLYGQMLEIDAMRPDWKKFSCSFVPSPGDRFAPTPDKVKTANVLVRAEAERPVALMKFHKAHIKFPHIRKELLLVDEFGGYHDVTKNLQELARRN